jgi:hypothetical protein
MILYYLNKDVKGAASKKVYGVKGDKIAILDNQIDMYLVIHESGNKFHVRQENVSSTFIPKDKINEKEKKRSKK